jgi:heat-inducible transcriptional repressor
MKNLKPAGKKSGKHDRERNVLLGLVDFYLKSGKPVGSNTLKEVGFENLSSATIRNYFAHLEEEDYLQQQHASGGRIPTNKAFRLYAIENSEHSGVVSDKVEKVCRALCDQETREIAAFLQQAAGQLAEVAGCATFLLAPRFEQDFIASMKLVSIDHVRCLCVLVTDFGEVLTEMLHAQNKLSAFTIKRIEEYFAWRLTGYGKPESLTSAEEETAQTFYNELMMRYVVSSSHFIPEEMYRTGFSKLLAYPELQDPTLLTGMLALFENTQGMRLLLRDCKKYNKLKFWIGDELSTFSSYPEVSSAVIAIPYYVNKQPVGAIGILGPVRIPYRQLFDILRRFSQSISETLTRSMYKFKINICQAGFSMLASRDKKLIGQTKRLLLEDKS